LHFVCIWLTQVVQEKRLLNRCSSSRSVSSLVIASASFYAPVTVQYMIAHLMRGWLSWFCDVCDWRYLESLALCSFEGLPL